MPAKAVGQVEIAELSMGGRPRVRCRGYAKALRLRAMLDTGAYPSIRALGREVGITGERVAQLLNLLQLAPDFIEMLEGPGPYSLDSKQVRKLAAIRGWEGQRGVLKTLVSAEPGSPQQLWNGHGSRW